MTQDVWDAVLTPLLADFAPPHYLRDNPEALERTLRTYERALSPYDRATLEQAWHRVATANRTWAWPPPGEIAAACREVAAPRTEPGAEERRRQQALDLADAYVTRYLRTSHLARLAEREGWSQPLRRYVSEAAWVQAQLLCQVRHIGWEPAVLLPDHQGHGSSREAFAIYRQKIQGSIARGHIRVAVPPSYVAGWKERVREGQGRDTAEAESQAGPSPEAVRR